MRFRRSKIETRESIPKLPERTRQLRLVLPVVAAAAVLGLVSIGPVLADYTPPAAPFASRIGPNGAIVQNQGTPLNASDAVSAWNTWTARSRLTLGTSGCGTTIACIIYANSGATLYYTACVLPTVPSGYWAATYVAANGYENTAGCTSLGSQATPIFVVAYRSAPSGGYLHVQRHELGHALALNDTSTACWPVYGWYSPLMNNGTYGTCPAYPNNVTASPNEIGAVISRNNW